MYESRHQPPVPRAVFLRRLAGNTGVAGGLIVVSLAAGMLGYAGFEGLGWVDAFLNASMLLGGMGPVNLPVTTGGKIFAGCYALYAGLVFIATAALLVTPLLHRLLHRLHWRDED